jgi:Protein of unknown function (DUF1353)
MPIGKYQRRALVELLNDGRRVKLEEPFAYIDPGKIRWQVPKDAVVDGASIPRMLWLLLGGPFEGKYRNASIIHDWYCDIRVRPWKQVVREELTKKEINGGRTITTAAKQLHLPSRQWWFPSVAFDFI